MDIEVVKAFTKTGSAVGLVCLVLYLLVENLFEEPVYQFFGSGKTFVLLLAILGLLFTVIIVSQKQESSDNKSKHSPKVTYKDSSTHNGDNKF